jgi:hypothetical protein
MARLNASLSALLAPGAAAAREAQPSDDDLVTAIRALGDEALAAYPRHRFDIAAKRFVEAIDRLATYARAADPASGNGRDTAVRVVRAMARAFSPLCPFILARFEEEVTQAKDRSKTEA